MVLPSASPVAAASGSASSEHPFVPAPAQGGSENRRLLAQNQPGLKKPDPNISRHRLRLLARPAPPCASAPASQLLQPQFLPVSNEKKKKNPISKQLPRAWASQREGEVAVWGTPGISKHQTPAVGFI